MAVLLFIESLIQPSSGTMSQGFCLGKCCIVLSGISSSMDPIREDCLITLFLTDWGKTAFAFLQINLQQNSFDYGLNCGLWTESCLFFISFPGLKNIRVKSSQISYYAILPCFQLPNLSEDYKTKTKH